MKILYALSAILCMQTAYANQDMTDLPKGTFAAGKLAIKLQPLQISGYIARPTVNVVPVRDGASQSVILSWNAKTTIYNLTRRKIYRFITPNISHNGYTCVPQFNPSILEASSWNTPLTTLSYQCSQAVLNNITLNVKGAPNSLNSLKVNLKPSNGTPIVSQQVPLANGTGTSSVRLVDKVSYAVSSDPVMGYQITYTPQPLISTVNGIENIELISQAPSTPVAMNGQLQVCGKQLCNRAGLPYQLKGISTHGLQWYGWGKCLTPASLDKLVSWGVSVIRLSMYVQEGGYETNPAGFIQQVNTLIDEATTRGIYAIVDFHLLDPGDPNYNFTNAQNFFTAIANAHKTNINLLYEIANEPNGVSWFQIKSYAERLIPVIRAIDNHSPILIGTTGWSSLGISEGNGPEEIINNPVNATNIMYTFHFYAASHKDVYFNALNTASNALPIFVTEFGEQTYTGDGANDFTYTDKYLDLMAVKKIGWVKWNYSDDFRSGAIWKTGTCGTGQWTEANLKPSGSYIVSKLKI